MIVGSYVPAAGRRTHHNFDSRKWGVLFSLASYPPLCGKLLNSDPAQDGRMALPKDRSIQAPQPLVYHALNCGPQRHLTLTVQRDDLFWIKAQLSLLRAVC